MCCYQWDYRRNAQVVRIRLSLSYSNTLDEVKHVLVGIQETVEVLRKVMK